MNEPGEDPAPELLILPDDPRAWEAVLTPPDDESVQAYRTVRTFLTRWHRGVCDASPIVHTEDYTDVEVADGTVVRAYGRIIADDGTDLTEDYLQQW